MPRRTIRQLGDSACARMEELGFSDASVKNYRRVFRRYEDYAAEQGRRHHEEGLADGFVAKAYGGSKGRQFADRACRVLGYFERTGEIPGRFARCDAAAPQGSARFLELYIADCVARGLSSKTVAARSRDLCQFLWHVEGCGVPFPAGFDAALIDSWAGSRHSAAPGNMHRSLSSVRCFLTHLFVVGLTESNLGPLVPSETRYPTRPVSKVWTDEEVASLVTSIPTADSVGKRDKAICMLLATYGMRSGDVCGLTLAGLDFDACTISYTQGKTGYPSVLPMTDGVAWALADWLRDGRPAQARCDEVFTTMCAPYGPLSTVANVITRRMEEAGVAKVPGTSSGAHSLRHTVATKMVSAGASLPVVSSVLGHAAENTTMIYLHADVDALRRCALGEGVV